MHIMFCMNKCVYLILQSTKICSFCRHERRVSLKVKTCNQAVMDTKVPHYADWFCLANSCCPSLDCGATMLQSLMHDELFTDCIAGRVLWQTLSAWCRKKRTEKKRLRLSASI